MSLDRRDMERALPGYEIGAEAGRGAFGLVFTGRHKSLGRDVAIKQLPRALAADPAVRERFLAEGRVVAALQHPHVVPVYDFVEQDGLCLLVMEHLSGGTLGERLRSGTLSQSDACAVLLGVLLGLQHAHNRGVLHRDIKPENVLFAADGTPKLADFGIAKVIGSDSTHTLAGVLVGTPAFMAPEQASGDPIGPTTDVYACGVMLYEALTGRFPFKPTSSPTAALMQHLTEEPAPITGTPSAIARVVMKALAKRPADRYPSAEAFAADLVSAAQDAFGADWPGNSAIPIHGAVPRTRPATPTVAPQGRPDPVRLPETRSRKRPLILAAAAVGVLLLVVAGAVMLAVTGGRTPSPSPTAGDYSPAARQAILDSCTQRGEPIAACTCVADGLKGVLTPAQYNDSAAVVAELNSGSPGPKLRQLVLRCTNRNST